MTQPSLSSSSSFSFSSSSILIVILFLTTTIKALRFYWSFPHKIWPATAPKVNKSLRVWQSNHSNHSNHSNIQTFNSQIQIWQSLLQHEDTSWYFYPVEMKMSQRMPRTLTPGSGGPNHGAISDIPWCFLGALRRFLFFVLTSLGALCESLSQHVSTCCNAKAPSRISSTIQLYLVASQCSYTRQT